MTTPSPDTDKTARVESSDERSSRRRPGQVSQFAPGTIIAGRYRIAGILGSGGMGEVYRGEGSGFFIFLWTAAGVVLTAGGLLAWRNLRQRRGDRPAAARIATAMFLLSTTAAILMADHEPVLRHEIAIFASSIAEGLLTASLFALLYFAVEPYVRRRWPDRLISWARLVGGRWRDPMIGRDVLIGIVAGLIHTVLAAWGEEFKELVTGIPAAPFCGWLPLLGSPLTGFASFGSAIPGGVAFGLAMMTILMLLTVILRRRRLAVIAFFAIMFTGYLFASTEISTMPMFLMIAAVYTFIPTRYGLLAAAAMHMAFMATFTAPLPDAFAWYTARGLVPLVLLLALAIWAFFTSLGGQRAFATSLLDD